MRTDDQKSSDAMGPLLLAGAAALLSFIGAIDIARAVAEMGPRVGDVLAYKVDRVLAPEVDSSLDVTRTDHTTCRVDVATLQQSGGSLVVEQRQPGTPRAYQVHWSGQRTTTDNANCGSSADLLLHDTDMEVLAMAAGGYGVRHRQLALTGAWGTDSEPVQQRGR